MDPIQNSVAASKKIEGPTTNDDENYHDSSLDSDHVNIDHVGQNEWKSAQRDISPLEDRVKYADTMTRN